MSRGIRQFVCAVLLFFGASLAAHAQAVRVQSGEHDGFTRLVVDVGPDRTWSIEGDASRPVIRFDPGIASFDLSQVFSTIPRTRLNDLALDDGLVLDLACACPVSASRYRSRYLVLDIADETARDTAPADDQVSESSDADDPDAAARRVAAAESLPDLTRLILESATEAEPSPSTDFLQAQAVETAAAIMAEQLARAAASGLIEAAPGRPLSDADPLTSIERTVPGTGPAAAELGRIEDIPFDLPIRAETAVDIALQRAVASEMQRPRLVCTGQEFSLVDWSDGTGVYSGLGQLRAAVYDDRGVIDRRAVVDLARHYISYGFGAEAAYWLAEIPNPPESMVALASIVDGAETPVFPHLADAAVCSPGELLWRYVDGSFEGDLGAEEVSAIQRATAALPMVLRDQLGPRIARDLSADGHVVAARNVRDMLVLGGRLSNAALLRLDLDLGLRGGTPEGEIRADLATALRDERTASAEAMAHVLRFDRETGQPVSEARLVAAEAILREDGVQAATAGLWREVVLALARVGDLDGVIHYLGGVSPDPESHNDVLTAVFEASLQADDIASLLLLTRMFGTGWTATGSEAGRTRIAVMAVLRDHGFWEAAEILRSGQRMLILPARPAPAPQSTDIARQAWIAEDWLELAGVVDGVHHDLALRMQNVGSPTPQDQADLSTLVDTLQDTAALRRMVDAILDDPTPDMRTP